MQVNGMDIVGMGKPWEEMPVGYKYRTVSRTISEADLVQFISATGMIEVLFTTQPKDGSPRLIPAALIYSYAEGLLINSVIQGHGMGFLNMTMDIKGPTYVGDTIYVECEVIESRESKGRPGAALSRTRNRIIKQDGTVVMEYTPLRLIRGHALEKHY